MRRVEKPRVIDVTPESSPPRLDELIRGTVRAGLSHLNPGNSRINQEIAGVVDEYVARAVPPMRLGLVDILENCGLLPAKKGVK